MPCFQKIDYRQSWPGWWRTWTPSAPLLVPPAASGKRRTWCPRPSATPSRNGRCWTRPRGRTRRNAWAGRRPFCWDCKSQSTPGPDAWSRESGRVRSCCRAGRRGAGRRMNTPADRWGEGPRSAARGTRPLESPGVLGKGILMLEWGLMGLIFLIWYLSKIYYIWMYKCAE